MEFAAILPALGGTAWTLLFFVIALSVIVAIHEYGHYIVGRWCGIHAEVFSIGFGKVLVSRVDRHGTKWQIAALPFGGYVKFLGDANAASVGGTDTVGQVDPRRTMQGAPLWARALTVAAGPVFNFLSAFVILTGNALWNGEVIEPLTFSAAPDLPDSYVSELARGDQILAVDGIGIDELGTFLQNAQLVSSARTVMYDVLRDGQNVSVAGPHPRMALVSGVLPRSAADDAGLRVGDIVTQINGTEIHTFDEIIAAKDASLTEPLALTIYRDGQTFEATMTPRRIDQPSPEGGFEATYLIGLHGGLFFDPETRTYGLFEAVPLALENTWRGMTTQLSGMWHLLTGAISSCNLSGPVGIAQTAGSVAQQGAGDFVLLIASLSIAIGLLNLMPVPILDGGHLVFHAYEAVARRKPSAFALNVLMSFGAVLIAGLMIFGLMNDLVLCP